MPAEPTQFAANLFEAVDIPLQLGNPVILITARRRSPAAGVGVPETAVNKNGRFQVRKKNVGLPGQCGLGS